jgi:hypothetical protein
MIARTISVPPTLRAFAMFVVSLTEESPELATAADELYLERDRLTYEGKAMLALALKQIDTAPDKQKQLLSNCRSCSTDRHSILRRSRHPPARRHSACSPGWPSNPTIPETPSGPASKG